MGDCSLLNSKICRSVAKIGVSRFGWNSLSTFWNKNVDNFVDRWVKFDILGRKLVKKGDKFQDIGVNEQKYNVDKM